MSRTETANELEFVIIGAGGSGLTCGVMFVEDAEFQAAPVTIYTKDPPAETTSMKAGAVWYPYHAGPQERVPAWCGRTWERFYELMAAEPVERTGVYEVVLNEYFDREPEQGFPWRDVIPDYEVIAPADLPEHYRGGFGYRYRVPMIDVTRYIPWLIERFAAGGGVIELQPLDREALRRLAVPGRVIINCAGSGAGELFADPEVRCERGQTFIVHRPGIAEAYLDTETSNALAHVFPRLDGRLVLGGTAGESNLGPEPDEAVRSDILLRAAILLPALGDLAGVEGEDVVGFRPVRDSGVRLELEEAGEGGAVIHNYGHGGAGYTLSWGCAEEVVELARGFAAVRRVER